MIFKFCNLEKATKNKCSNPNNTAICGLKSILWLLVRVTNSWIRCFTGLGTRYGKCHLCNAFGNNEESKKWGEWGQLLWARLNLEILRHRIGRQKCEDESQASTQETQPQLLTSRKQWDPMVGKTGFWFRSIPQFKSWLYHLQDEPGQGNFCCPEELNFTKIHHCSQCSGTVLWCY